MHLEVSKHAIIYNNFHEATYSMHFSAFSLAMGPPRNLQITAYK